MALLAGGAPPARLVPGQIEEVRVPGAGDEAEGHAVLRILPRVMRGAIAAGHPVTAEAGAQALASGGNAVDAAVAAGVASWVAESPLTGPGGGGFMLVHRARDRSTRLLDFFVTVPSGGADVAAMNAVDVAFDNQTRQLFLIGPASVAVPGIAAGLELAHRRFGSLPWRELVAPAVDLARLGVEVTPTQDYLHDILAPIVGRSPGIGKLLRFVDFAATLERIAAEGASILYSGEIAEAMCSAAPQITPDDLAGFRVIRRRPVTAPFRGHTFASNPPPASGGVLIAYGLRRLEALARFGSHEVIETMRAQDAARDDLFQSQLYRGGLARRLVEAPSMTTHISVVDGEGNAASLSCSLGSGSGVVIPGTGIFLNNMLGEHDLAGLHRRGSRLTSMMAPSICFVDDRARVVVGSAGSARLRGAIMQVVANVLGHGMDVGDAVNAPRVHWDDGVVQAEDGADVAGFDPTSLNQWGSRNLYFGGVNAVEVLDDGSPAAAADPRRGGAAIVVE
jgi:gamma-glutamyltranspeptidase/glutathione hydrolase